MDSESRHLGNQPLLLAHGIQIEYFLQRYPERTFPNKGDGPDDFAVVLGAKCGRRWQGVIDRNPHPGGVWLHEAAIDVSIVKHGKTGFELFLRLGNLQLKTGTRRRIAICKRTIDFETLIPRKPGDQLSYRYVQKLTYEQANSFQHFAPSP